MAFKLSKEENAKRDELASAIRVAREALDEAVETFNATLSGLRGPVEEALTAYNETLDQAREMVEALAADKRAEYDERTERWQEGEKGEAANGWIDDIESKSCELDEVEIDFPEEIDCAVEDHAQVLDDIASEAE